MFTMVPKETETFQVLFPQTCIKGNNDFKLILQISYNCVAENELKNLNRIEIDAPLK